jgi:predicted dehydrogenase
MSKSHLSRRQFVGSSLSAAGVGASFAIGGTKSSGRVLGANDAIRLAVAGLHGRGGDHVRGFAPIADVEISYLVDPDTRTYATRLKQVATSLERAGKSTGQAPKTVQDIRRALDDKSLDAVSVATPNHWHALITIWACQAGKDVYVEKPCSHNVHEGRIAVDAARRYGRIVQHGTQGRSSRDWARAVAAIQSGKLGKLLVSRALCYNPRASIGFKSNASPPGELDFNIWLGPAPRQPYHENLVHYNWHWFWDFGNGDIGNQGVHQMDVARWLIPGSNGASATYPKSVLSLGGRFGYRDQGQTANTQIAVMDYGDTQLIFEVRGLKTDAFHHETVGNVAHLEEGTIVGGPEDRATGGRFYPRGKTEPIPLSKLVTADVKRGPGSSHYGNFIAAVRSRRVEDLNADILQGHYSAALCHLANISYRLGSEVPLSNAGKAFGDDREAYETLSRMEEHLKENRLALDGLNYRLGRKFAFDGASESFPGDADANRMLTRPYREPFVVPERIG